ncbi:hypothetical protein JCM3775_007235 [Rhodotorula graminis]|uniref:3-oxo-5-alpha-steroid 4-dehydrogenase C-terminal domain-containing protein n=1 Tax=Rhodotorula graminis (strain WP1) TaxID=578459 RepID=A0A194SET9_RHOGW|nr:uncharacterized protein RHOBADRAFT_50552 [Rhodotorula graminis WP1]KPV78031.1 hypothetical protein RHOBADRAFT_50552 [Rhodotorula graminis WP1]
MSLVAALEGHHGTLGLYAAVQRLFCAFGCFALPGSLLLDAPFGRFGTWSNALTVNGDLGWLVMEAFAPLTFLCALALPLTTTPLSRHTLLACASPSTIVRAFLALDRPRQLLATLFLVHYSNRSVIGTLRNPGRAPMHLVIPVLSALFNFANGGTLGAWLSAGGRTAGLGLKAHSPSSRALFALGVGLWAAGFAGNIFHDEHLYALKRAKQRSLAKGKAKASSSSSGSGSGSSAAQGDNKPPAHERYSIPTRGLYALVSHPSYLCEWVEWSGFALAALQLAPAPFPSSTSAAAAARGVLQPLAQWYLQPPVLFVLQEVAAMLPRARSGHAWYKRTFGAEWERKGARWAVIPGVY